MKTTNFSIVCLLTLFSATAIADFEDDLIGLYDEEELISIATGTEQQVRFAPSVASVITRQDIEESGARTLDEALEMVPGLHVSASFNRQDAVYSIRGIHTPTNPQVQLLVDGVQVTQTFSGARPYNYTLPAAHIERIEVIRGPGSAVYGADAFAGVISVTTVAAADGEATKKLGGRLTTFDDTKSIDTRETWLHYRDEIGGLDVAISLNHVKNDGDEDQIVEVDSQTQEILTLNAAASLAPGPLETRYELLSSQIAIGGDGWNATAFTWNLNDGGLGTGGGQALDPVGADSSDYYGVKLDFDPHEIADDTTISGKLGATVLDQEPKFVLFPQNALLKLPPLTEA